MTKTDSVVGPAADETAAGQRRKFYGRRKGRKLRVNQQGWIDDLLPSLTVALPADGGQLDPADLFPRPMDDIWLEIGFGGGEHLAAQAAALSDDDIKALAHYFSMQDSPLYTPSIASGRATVP